MFVRGPPAGFSLLKPRDCETKSKAPAFYPEGVQHGTERIRARVAKRQLAERLAKETGITEQRAAELIHLIGTDWTALLREAQFLKNRH
ncbi:hypothetical protein FJ417_22115 [Mesorhizobium sp. B3-1-7]|nr:hypothetical protein FJ417_22115 [Mesorhizobium sp. B3-1-7]TPJ37077.1 hypothetical protein FJ418_02100 [Mesorhizobium sp. B2-8-3]